MKDRDTIKWLYKITKKQIPTIIFLSISNALLAAIGVSIALLSKKVIDSAVRIAAGTDTETKDYSTLIIYGVLIFIVISLRVVTRILTQSMSVKAQARMEMGMRAKMFQSILDKDYSKISKYHSGELMNRLTSDISIVSNGMVSIIPDTTYIVVQFSGAFVALMFFDWKFALVFVAGGLVVFFIICLFKRKLKFLHKLVQQTDGRVRSFFQENIESLIIVKTFGIQNELMSKGNVLQEDNYDAKMRRRKVNIYANAGFGFVFNIGYLYALLWCSFKLCARAMTYGTLTAVLQLINQVQMPFVNFTKIFPQLFAILASAERIMEIESMESEGREETIDVATVYDNMSKIVFDEVKFSYERDTVLEGGKVEIGKGEFAAIRGISGIGKSTLLKMLLGVFAPDSGKIEIVDRNGDSMEADVVTRDMFSYVPQGNYLFSGTLRENLKLVNPEATDDEITNALRVSESYDFVQSLPDGLDTVIGEKGLGLSEGQVQRIAIARAIVCKSPIILLDEATSALDYDTEVKVLNNIRALKSRTCIIITHKQAAIDVCDKEIVIEKKKIYVR
ncbi:MAG: ABC transporter ATP-binding protein/permease [Lachnospiraceae bacterium]|nr:ABC transporter ATP-binding protein/permease [Lachnospiraceae bacterium]